MVKTTKKQNKTFIHKCIPYRYCFEEAGMIETEQGVYTRCYRIQPPEGTIHGNYNAKKTRRLIQHLLKQLTENFTFEFTVRNCRVDRTEYLSRVMLNEEENADGCQHFRKLYNQVLRDNCDIGHNNFNREVYLTISLTSDTPDIALQEFMQAEPWIKEVFMELYGFRAVPMELTERLELLYNIYHPGERSGGFGKRVDYNGRGFSIRSMKHMKMDTKDTIAPEIYDCGSRDHMRIDSCYARTFFINSIPESVPDSILLDLASVSSHSILSVYYERVDKQLGFTVAARRVQQNTKTKVIPVRDTVADRREHCTIRQETPIRENEEEYFYRSALELFKEAKAGEQEVIKAAFVITLFAESMEELERDSSLLILSASKYVCQIRCLDLQQNEGFQSVLPLNNPRVHVGRVFSLEQMAVMQPINLQGIFDKNLSFYGLNAINDNLVFIDRTNYATAMITGNAHTGKTTAVKREVLNTLIGTKDTVIVLARHPEEYVSLAEKLNGQVIREFYPDIFEKDSNYNLNGVWSDLQRIFLAAYLTVRTGFHKQQLAGDVLQECYLQVEREADALCRLDKEEEVMRYAKEHPAELPLFIRSMDSFSFHADHLVGNRRLVVLCHENESQLLVNLDYLWNFAVACKKKNRNVWIFVDSADEFLYSVTGSDYLFGLMERAETLKVPLTIVLQDVVHIVTDPKASMEFDDLLTKVRFFKLLSLGPIERKRFVDRLNISDQLVPYFVERGPGEGILVTPSANVAVSDRLEQESEAFYRLFR